jgi:hypothetical protein
MRWISLRAHAERFPARLTLTFTLGELPPGWTKATRPRAIRIWIGALGLLLIAPIVLLFVAGGLRLAGSSTVYEWIASSPVAILAASISLFIGLPIAFVLNAWPIARVGLRHRAGQLEGLVGLEFAPLHLIVVVIAVLVGGLFVGHLAADTYACMNGVHSAC